MRFTSPTINMYAENDDYLRFLRDIKGHFATPMIAVENYVDHPIGGNAYPRGRVGDSEWVFNHDVTAETPIERWNRGVERFNHENFIAVMTIMSDEAAHEFDSLPIKYKIGFYWKDMQLDSIVHMPEWSSPEFRAQKHYSFSGLVNRVVEESGVHTINWMRALFTKTELEEWNS